MSYRVSLIAEDEIILKADNSSGSQEFSFCSCLEEDLETNEKEITFNFKLVGKFNNKDIQIDFDAVTEKEYETLIYKMLDVLKKTKKVKI